MSGGLQNVERWISPGTAARILDCHRVTVWRYLREGRLLAKKLPSGYWRIAFPIQKVRELDRPEK